MRTKTSKYGDMKKAIASAKHLVKAIKQDDVATILLCIEEIEAEYKNENRD